MFSILKKLRSGGRIAAFLFSLVVASSVQASWDEAAAAVENTTKSMFRLMEDPASREEANFSKLNKEIDNLLNDVIDFDYLAKAVMGRYYRQASDTQVQRFQLIFRDTMVRTYTKAMVGFDLDHYRVMPQAAESPDPSKQIVTVHVYSSVGQEYTLVYYLVKKSDGWVLTNVVLDGINLRINFRNQFADLVSSSRGNIGDAISKWEATMSDKAALK